MSTLLILVGTAGSFPSRESLGAQEGSHSRPTTGQNTAQATCAAAAASDAGTDCLAVGLFKLSTTFAGPWNVATLVERATHVTHYMSPNRPL